MRSKRMTLACMALTVTVAAVIGLAGCGGGTGGSGPFANIPAFLAFTGFWFGNRDAGLEYTTPYPVIPSTGVPVPVGGSVTVDPAQFASSNPGSQDYIQLTFNLPLKASTIFNPAVPGADGIGIFLMSGGVANPVLVALDALGLVNPANAFPATDQAPAIIRIYFDTDSDVTTPEAFPPGTTSSPSTRT